MEKMMNTDAELKNNSTDFNSDKKKTSLRMNYEAQCEVIKQKIGSIEEVRTKLGLSRRKICQTLMVDPSAWSRWMKNEDSIPPHIYRSLQWYLELIDKEPIWHPKNHFDLSKFSSEEIKSLNTKLNDLTNKIELSEESFESKKARNIIVTAVVSFMTTFLMVMVYKYL